jgi:DNA-binding phage protein
MNSVKLATGKYQDYLTASLRDPAAAAAYLNAILAEPDPEPGLFCDALGDVTMALGTSGLRTEVPTEVPKLGDDGIAVIHALNEYLSRMGLQLVIAQIPDVSLPSTL